MQDYTGTDPAKTRFAVQLHMSGSLCICYTTEKVMHAMWALGHLGQ